MTDSEGAKGFDGFLKPAVTFKEGLQVTPEALVVAANQMYAFDPEKRAEALSGVVQTEITKLNASVTARLELLTQPLVVAEDENPALEKERITKQIQGLELKISRQVDAVKEIILQIPNHDIQVVFAQQVLHTVEGVPLVIAK